jgi:hypothetical protein
VAQFLSSAATLSLGKSFPAGRILNPLNSDLSVGLSGNRFEAYDITAHYGVAKQLSGFLAAL